MPQHFIRIITHSGMFTCTAPILCMQSALCFFCCSCRSFDNEPHRQKRQMRPSTTATGPRDQKRHAKVKLRLFGYAVRKDTRDQAMLRPGAAARSEKTHATVKLWLVRRAVRKDTRDRAALRPVASVRSEKTHTNATSVHQVHLCGWHYFLIPRALVISTCRELACDRSCMHSLRSFGKKCFKSDCALKGTKSTSPW